MVYTEVTNIELPVGYDTDGKYHIMFNINQTDELIGKSLGIVVQEESKEEAIRQFWTSLRCHIHYLEERSKQLDKWKPLQIGPWMRGTGKWFSVFGLRFYFRVGKNMKYGWYVPFTNLNIMFTNHWRRNGNRNKV